MADEDLLDKVHSLSDLELAVLLCLINREHVLISTPPAAIDDLVQELQLVCCLHPDLLSREEHVADNHNQSQPAGSTQDIQPQARRRRLPPVHHARRLRLSPAPPSSPASSSKHSRPLRLALCPDVRVIFRSQPASALESSNLLRAALAPVLSPFSSNRPLCNRQEPRPRPASRPDPGPRTTTYKTHIYAHVGASRAEAIRLHTCRRGCKRWRGARYAASQRLLLDCPLA